MAEIVGVHGVKGAVKLKIFGDNPDALPGLAPLCDAKRKNTYEILAVKEHGNTWLAEMKGVSDRTAAEKLRGVKLYVARDRLPDLKKGNTFYHIDLVGLAAFWPDGREMGRVVNVANFGAGDLIEIKPPKGASFYVPFTKEIVPDVNLADKKLTVDPPPGLID